MHSSSKFWSSIWIFGLLLSGHANAEFVPVRLARTSSSIIARDLHSRAEILRPRYEIQLTYVDKNHSPARRERPYVIQVTTSHESRPYISLEDVDDMLSSISCSGSLDSPSTSILLSFNDHNDLVLARDQWDYPLGLTFITNHPSCNDGSSHGAYRASEITFDDETATAHIRCDSLQFGPGTDASTAIRFTGGVASHDLVKKLDKRGLRRRQEGRSSRAFSLDANWPGSQALFSVPGLDISCVDCSVTGELTAAFDIILGDLNPPDLLAKVGQGIVDDNLLRSIAKKMELSVQTTRDIRAALNYQFKASSAIGFGYPGLMPSTGKPSFEDKLVRTPAKKIFSFGQFSFKAGLQYGFGFGVNLAGSADISYPVTATIPANQLASVDLANLAATGSTIQPQIQAGPAKVNKVEASMCFTAGFGPGVDMALEVEVNDRTNASFVFGASIDAPKLQTCLSIASGVNKDCSPGSMANALREKTTIGVGLAGGAKFSAAVQGFPVPNVPALNLQVNPALHPEWTLDDRCFRFGGTDGSTGTVRQAQSIPFSDDFPVEDSAISFSADTFNPGDAGPGVIPDSSSPFSVDDSNLLDRARFSTPAPAATPSDRFNRGTLSDTSSVTIPTMSSDDLISGSGDTGTVFDSDIVRRAGRRQRI